MKELEEYRAALHQADEIGVDEVILKIQQDAFQSGVETAMVFMVALLALSGVIIFAIYCIVT